MKHLVTGAGLLALSVGASHAGGIERSTQSVGILFEQGTNYLELSYGRVRPSVKGTGLSNPFVPNSGAETGGIARNHYLPGISYKHEFNDKWSIALIYDHFYGADVAYGLNGSSWLAGTEANEQSEGYTALLRYRIDGNWSVHGGIRMTDASAFVQLGGAAYGPVAGYNASFKNDWAMGYVGGIAYERPDIALRVALTYQSKITHEFDTNERMGATPVASGGTTEVDTPEAVTLDFQTGVAPDWLVYGSVRWVHWSQFQIKPDWFYGQTNRSLVEIDNSTTYTLGIGHKFNDSWSGSIFATWETVTGDDLVTPFSPVQGYKGIGIAAVYTRGNMKITTGVRYLWLGDAYAQTAGTARADFSDNYAVAAGVRVGFTF
ncbi:OmpP1/FadL family transporter [Paenirhodobacter sp.]|uniref:OmpP1/FadL family transporter n=1 Tax=Paenirhodobacter sp. TaxID=1965326 RepID=UPI003B503AD8